MRLYLALAAAVALALIASAVPSQKAIEIHASAGILSEHELQAIEQLAPQQQAERLLERAISRYTGALDQIENRLPSWAGKLDYSKELQSLTSLAYNSRELRVRAAAIELTLSAFQIAKEPQAARSFMDKLKLSPENRPWNLWVLALLANRGVEAIEARRILLEFLRDPDDNTREWAVNSLAMLGTEDVIEAMLDVFGHDKSLEVRERAGCGLAESGMMTQEQRRKAIPGLMRLMDDSTLDEKTQSWVFQALQEISGQNHGTDRAAWHTWHNKQR